MIPVRNWEETALRTLGRQFAGIADNDVLRNLTAFFFFHAEDGIRHYKVTGVQTCALPISGWVTVRCRGRSWAGPAPGCARTSPGRGSEERRVGKEGRSRWAPDH